MLSRPELAGIARGGAASDVLMPQVVEALNSLGLRRGVTPALRPDAKSEDDLVEAHRVVQRNLASAVERAESNQSRMLRPSR